MGVDVICVERHMKLRNQPSFSFQMFFTSTARSLRPRENGIIAYTIPD
jgi:hypothetical protein